MNYRLQHLFSCGDENGLHGKNEDSQKVISLTLTAEQLEVIDGALKCIAWV